MFLVKLENFRVLFLRQRHFENMRFDYDVIFNVMKVAFSEFKLLQKNVICPLYNEIKII